MSVAALEIAGVRIDVALSGAVLPRRYALFAGASGAADWSIEVRGALAAPEPAEAPPARHVVETGGVWRVPGAEGEGWLHPAQRRGAASGTAVLDTLLRAAIGTIVVARGGLLVHGASVVVDGRAHLCPARSGSGKSTLAARASHPLADELSIVLPDAGGWRAVSTPWWTSRGGDAPLARVYELAWSREAIEDLPGTAMRHLSSNMVLVLDTPEARVRALAAAAAVSRTIPHARLSFRPDTDVDRLLRAGPATSTEPGAQGR